MLRSSAAPFVTYRGGRTGDHSHNQVQFHGSQRRRSWSRHVRQCSTTRTPAHHDFGRSAAKPSASSPAYAGTRRCRGSISRTRSTAEWRAESPRISSLRRCRAARFWSCCAYCTNAASLSPTAAASDGASAVPVDDGAESRRVRRSTAEARPHERKIG